MLKKIDTFLYDYLPLPLVKLVGVLVVSSSTVYYVCPEIWKAIKREIKLSQNIYRGQIDRAVNHRKGRK